MMTDHFTQYEFSLIVVNIGLLILSVSIAQGVIKTKNNIILQREKNLLDTLLLIILGYTAFFLIGKQLGETVYLQDIFIYFTGIMSYIPHFSMTISLNL